MKKQVDPLCIRSIFNRVSWVLPKIGLKVEQIQQAHDLIVQYLPQDLVAYVVVADVTPEKITLTTPDAVHATALRYQQGALVSLLRTHEAFAQLDHIKVKIALPRLAGVSSRLRLSPSLSPVTRALLQQTAESIMHPALKKALLRFAEGRRKDI